MRWYCHGPNEDAYGTFEVRPRTLVVRHDGVCLFETKHIINCCATSQMRTISFLCRACTRGVPNMFDQLFWLFFGNEMATVFDDDTCEIACNVCKHLFNLISLRLITSNGVDRHVYFACCQSSGLLSPDETLRKNI